MGSEKLSEDPSHGFSMMLIGGNPGSALYPYPEKLSAILRVGGSFAGRTAGRDEATCNIAEFYH